MSSSLKDLGQTGVGKPSPIAEKRAASGPSSGEWLVNVAGDVVVPMTIGRVIEGLRAGRLSERSLVWRIGMHDWTALFDVPQLRLAAGAEPAPPSSGRVVVHLEPLKAQAEARRRRDTLPFGFPTVHAGGARYSNSLAPMASDATTTVQPQMLGGGDDRSVISAGEYRAVKATSKRLALWAALGSIAIASVVISRLVHVPALHVAETTQFRATTVAEPAPEPSTSVDSVAPPITSQVAPLIATGVSAPSDAVPKPVAQPRRKKTPAAASAAPTSSTLSQAEVISAPSASAPSASAPSAVPGARPSAAPGARPSAGPGAPAVSARPAAPP